MKLIIDIPDHLYKLLKDFPSDSNETTIENVLMKAVENGTPLPKGHGRLIDADDYAKKFDTNINGRIGEEYIIAPTIIEADKAESEDKG